MPDGHEDRSSIFVVYGRNEALRDLMFRVLRALGLKPQTWSELKKGHAPATHTFDVIDKGIRSAYAVVVLLSDDEEVRLRAPFYDPRFDSPDEWQPRAQSRPNVFIEAGMALALKFDKTLLVTFGAQRDATDLRGLQYFPLAERISANDGFVLALRDIGCPVRVDSAALEAIDFREALPMESEIPATEAFRFELSNGDVECAGTLAKFREIVERLDYGIFRNYLRNGDFERWFGQSFRDPWLAAGAQAAREQDQRPGGNGRDVLLATIARRYRV